MKYIAIYKDKHYLINDSSQISAMLQAFGIISKDFNIDSIESTELTIIEPYKYITKYGELINTKEKTIAYNNQIFDINDANYTQNIGFFLEVTTTPKVIYNYKGKEYTIEG